MEDLTFRENKTLKLIVEGYNNFQIAEELGISLHTVKSHVSSIFRKLGCENRTQAAYIAIKNNLI